MREANCSTGHFMINTTTKLWVRWRMKKDKIPIRKIATSMIKINRVRDDHQASLNDRLAEISPGTLEEKWNAYKSIMYKVSKEKLSIEVRKLEDRFNGNSMELEEFINNRNLAKNNMFSKNTKSTKNRYRTCCQLLQQKCRELKNKLRLTKVAELQILAD